MQSSREYTKAIRFLPPSNVSEAIVAALSGAAIRTSQAGFNIESSSTILKGEHVQHLVRFIPKIDVASMVSSSSCSHCLLICARGEAYNEAAHSVLST
jgi:hypothetical protein